MHTAATATCPRALKLVDFLSRRYGVSIPDRLWFDLLNWTYVFSSKPASTEWKMVNDPGRRITSPDDVTLLWSAMVAEPHSVRPGLAQYDILIKSLIERGRHADAITADARDEGRVRGPPPRLRGCHGRALARAPPARQRGQLMARFRRAAAKKWHAWYCFQVWCRKLLKKYTPFPRARRVRRPHHTRPGGRVPRLHCRHTSSTRRPQATCR